MKIKLGTVKKDVTSFGNKYWIQIQDNKICDNCDLELLENMNVTVIIGEVSAIDNLIQQSDIL
jgi:hypothetical protein